MTIDLWCQPDLPRVSVSGTAPNMTSSAHRLYVTNSTAASFYEGEGPEWSLEVAADQPFQLMAVEYGTGDAEVSPRGVNLAYFGWKWVEHPAVSAPITLTLDFSQPEVVLTPTTPQRTLPLPARDHALGGRS